MLKYFIFVLLLSSAIPQLLFSQNGWIVQPNPLKNVFDVQFLNSLTGYACGDSGRVIRTTNGGNNWEIVHFNLNYRSFTMTAVDFLDFNTGIVAGYESSTGLGQTILLRTTNAAGGWQTLLMGSTYNIAIRQDVKMLGKDTIIYCRFGRIDGSSSGDGELKYTFNGGSNWITSFLYNGFTSLNFIDNKIGWVNEYHPYHGGLVYNKIHRTTNSGLNWFTQQSDSTSFAMELSLHFLNRDMGYAIGVVNNGNTKFLKTTDGGNNWDLTIFNIGASVRKLYFTNINTGWIVGTTNLLRTTNGGNNWNTVSNSWFTQINNIFFLNDYVGWMCGTQTVQSSIIKTLTGGIMNVEQISELPASFELMQNYPNPFNPVTTIKFGIPKNSSVKLAIFDIAGKQVEVLADKKLSSGNYSILWNAEDMPSGIYFYKLSSNNFSEVKKMVLLK